MANRHNRRPLTAKVATKTFRNAAASTHSTNTTTHKKSRINSRPNTGKDSLVPVDHAMAKVNKKETLKYFSNISSVRDLCTKEQLGEFVELMHQKGSTIMQRPG